MASTHTDLSSVSGLGKLNGMLSRSSYIVGYGPTQDDLTVLARLPRFVDANRFPNIVRWANHISSFSEMQRATFPGDFKAPAAPTSQKKAPKKVQPKKEQNQQPKKAAAPKKAAPAKKAPKKEESSSDEDSDESSSDEDSDEDSDESSSDEDSDESSSDEDSDESSSGSDSGDDFDLEDSDDDEETKALLQGKAAEIKAIQARQAAKKGKAKSNLTLDIKPYEAATDMKQVEKMVRKIKLKGIKWLGGSLIDVAYGVQKLRIMVQFFDEQCTSDAIIEQVDEMEDVQSCDVFAVQMA